MLSWRENAGFRFRVRIPAGHGVKAGAKASGVVQAVAAAGRGLAVCENRRCIVISRKARPTDDEEKCRGVAHAGTR